MKRYTLKLRPLTAVHVGTGSTISRLEYTIRSRKEGLKAFLRFQPDKVVEALPEDKLSTFLNLTDGKDFIGLGKFLGENLPQSAVWYLGSCTTGLAGQFTEKATDDMNRLEIEEQYRAPGQVQPVIPGSAIKGALRTALLATRVEGILGKAPGALDGFLQWRERFDSKFQQTVLRYSKPNDDPFRVLSIPDCPFDPRGTQLVGRLFQYKPFRRDGQDFETIAINAEVLRGMLCDSEVTGILEVIEHNEINQFSAPEYGALKNKGGRKVIDKPINLKEVLEACDKFYYGQVFYEEYNKFYTTSEHASVKNIADKLADLVDELHDHGEYLIRIGRWSHVESVTMKGLRNPRSRNGYGKTRTLFEYEGTYLPMGWCTLKMEDNN